MPAIPQRDLSPLLKWHPWPNGDPAPEIWQIIQELDRRLQLEVVGVILNSQTAQTQAHLEGLQGIQKVISQAQ